MEYIVTTLADSGTGSLRDAIAQANAYTGGEEVIISFDPSLEGTITLASSMNLRAGAALNLSDKVVLESSQYYYDLYIESGTKLVGDGATIRFTQHSRDNGGDMSSLVVRSGGSVELTDCRFEGYSGSSVEGNISANPANRNIAVQSGGSLSLEGCTLYEVGSFEAAAGATLDIRDTALVNLRSGAATSINDSTIEGWMTIWGGAVISGGGNVFTGQNGVIELADATVDFSDFHASAAEEGCYIKITGSEVKSSVNYTKLGEGLGTYQLGTALYVRSGATLNLGDDVVLESNECSHDIYVEGRMEFDHAEVRLMGHSDPAGRELSTLRVNNGGEVNFRNTRIEAYNATNNHYSAWNSYDTYNLEVLSGGVMTLADCELEHVNYFNVAGGAVLDVSGTKLQNLASWGDTTLNGSTIEGLLTLGAGAALHGRDNIFTGSGEVLRLADAAVSPSDFHASAAEEGCYIKITGSEVKSSVNYTKLGEGLGTYQLGTALYVRSGATLNLGDDVVLESNECSHDIYVEGRMEFDHAEVRLMGHSDPAGRELSTLRVNNGGEVNFRNTRIEAYNATNNHYSAWNSYDTYNLEVLSGGVMTLADCELEHVNYFNVAGGAVLDVSGTKLQNLASWGDTTLNGSTIEGLLTLGAGAALHGRDNIFTGSGEVLRLADAAVSPSDFHASAAEEGCYIKITGSEVKSSVNYTKLGDGLGTYQLGTSLYVRSGATLNLGDNVVLESSLYYNDVYVESGAKLVGDGATIRFTQHSRDNGGDMSSLVVRSGGSVELTDCRFEGYSGSSVDGNISANPANRNIAVQSGGSLSLDGCTLYEVGSFEAAAGATLDIRDTTLVNLRSGAATTINDSTIEGWMTMWGGVAISGGGNVFTGQNGVIELADATVDFSDFHASAVEEGCYIKITGSEVKSSVNYTKLGDGLGEYRLQTTLNVLSGATLTLAEGVDLRTNYDICVKADSALESVGASIYIEGFSEGRYYGEGNCSTLMVENGGTVKLSDTQVYGPTGVKNMGWDPYQRNIYVRAGGVLEMDGCELHEINYFNAEAGATLVIKETTLQNLLGGSTLTMNNSTVTGTVEYTSGTVVRGSGNVFSGSGEVMILHDATVDLTNLQARAEQTGAYIGIAGASVNKDTTYAVLGDGLGRYHLKTTFNVLDGATLTLTEGVELHVQYDICVKADSTLECESGSIYIDGFDAGRYYGEGNCSTLLVENGGTARLKGTQVYGPSGASNIGWDPNQQNIYVYAGGVLELDGCGLHDINYFRAEAGASLVIKDTTLQRLSSGCTLSMNKGTVAEYVEFNAGSVISGSDNVFTGSGDVIRLNEAGLDLSGFHADAVEGNDCYISVKGNQISGAANYVSLGDGLGRYVLGQNMTITEEGSLRFGEGASVSVDRSMDVYGSLHFDKGSMAVVNNAIYLHGGADFSADGVGFSKDGSIHLREWQGDFAPVLDNCLFVGGATIIVDGIAGDCSFQSCIDDVTYTLNNMTIGAGIQAAFAEATSVESRYLVLEGSLDVQGAGSFYDLTLVDNARLAGDDISISGSLKIESLTTSVDTDVVFSGMPDTKLDGISYITVKITDYDVTLGAMPDGVPTYQISHYTSGWWYDSPKSTIGQSAHVTLKDGAVLKIVGLGSADASQARTYFDGSMYCGAGTELIVGNSVGGLFARAGSKLTMENAKLTGTIHVEVGAEIVTDGCTFSERDVLRLESWYGDTALLAKAFDNAKFSKQPPVVRITGLSGDATLSAFANEEVAYAISDNFSTGDYVLSLGEGAVYDGEGRRFLGHLACNAGSVLKGGIIMDGGATLDVTGAVCQGALHLRKGVDAELRGTEFAGGQVVAYAGSSVKLTGCSGAATLTFEQGASVEASGNDFSRVGVVISGSAQDGGMIDLSGNYWGATDMDVIMSRISGDKSKVVINDFLLVDPLTNFVYAGNTLRNGLIGMGVSSFDIELTHEIDVSSFADGDVRLVDARGNELALTGVSVQGKSIHVEFEPQTVEATYRLVLGSGIKDITGAGIVSADGLDYVAEIKVDLTCPRVSHMEPGGDFVGTLSELKVYFTDAVDAATLKSGVTILDPTGRRVEITKVRDLGGNAYVLEVAPQTAYGQYSVRVGTDVMDRAGNRLNQNGNAVGGEADDVFESAFCIADVDLTITDVQVAGELTAGGKVSVTWSGENASGYALMGSWTDGVYLSQDARWDVGDLLLGSYEHTGGLAQGVSYNGNLELSLPGVAPGEYYLLVRSDMFGKEQVNKESAEWAQNLMAVPVTVSIPSLEVDNLWIGEMTPEDSFDYIVIHQPAGQSMKLVLDSSDPTAKLEMFVGYGRVPGRESYDAVATGGSLIIPSRPAGGDVYVMVNNKTSNVALQYTLDAQGIPMSVTAVTPTTQGQNSSSTFDIYGVNFTAGTKVVLVGSDGTEYVPDSLSFISSERIRIKYDALRLPAEKLDVVVRSETETVTVDDCITISSASGAHLKIAKVLPNVLGYHIQNTLQIVYENTGNDPMHAPLLSLTGKQNGKTGAIMTMDPALRNNGFWTSAMPEGFSNTVSFLAYSPGTPGWVMPTGRDAKIAKIVESLGLGSNYTGQFANIAWYKENTRLVHSGPDYQVSILNDPSVLSKLPKYTSANSLIAGRSAKMGGVTEAEMQALYGTVYGGQLTNTVNIYYCGWQQPWDYSYPPFKFEIGYLGTDNTTPLNWYDSFSYTDMPHEQKVALANSLTASAGDTWGDYVLMLNKNLIYLDELGCVSAGRNSTYDTDSLDAFEIAKANGSYTPVQVLSSSVDMSAMTTGLELSVCRAYRSDISSRFQDGAFGYGWTFNWDVSLKFREDGTAVMQAPGSQRIFQPDYRGGYLNASTGDTGTFDKAKDGGYTLTEQSGLVWKFAADGKLLSQTDTNGNSISCTYNEDGKLTRLTHSNGEFIAIEWDAAGHISMLSDANDDTVTYDYANGHLVKATNYLCDSVSYAYSDQFAHALVSVTGWDGISTEFSYNGQGLLENTSSASAEYGVSGYEKVTLTYGDNGEVTVTDVFGASSTYYYDDKGNVRRAVDVNGNTMTYGYDANGNMTWFTDQAGNTSAWAYDAYGNVTSTTNALGYTTTYTYTASGQLDVLTDALGRSTDYDYDSRGNMTCITYVDGSSETWTYDAVGNTDSWTNRRGSTIWSEYDQYGHLTSRKFEDGSVVSYIHDSRGNLTSVTDSSGTTSYVYDERDRVSRIEFSSGHSLSYGFDDKDRRASMVDENGNVTRYEWNAMGMLSRVMDGGGAVLVEYDYDQGGRLQVERRGNGTTTEYSYTLSGQVSEMLERDAAGSITSFSRYTYDKVGLRASMETQDGKWIYGYDKIGQLTSAVFTPAEGSTLAAQDLRYEYDAVGNRIRSVVNGVETVYTVNSLNQTESAGDVLYEYDEDGNMIKKTDATGVTLFMWDDENQLIRVETAAGDVYAYTYNSSGDRISMSVNGKTTDYLYEPSGCGNLLAEYDSLSGEQTRTYTYGNGLIGFDDAMAGTFWYQGDALGSVTGITDASGKLIATYSYDPFGKSLSSNESASIANPFQWVGQWGLSLDITGLVLAGARYYDQNIGKFISSDPLGIVGGQNLYVYCGNNAMSLIDPSGLAGINMFGYEGWGDTFERTTSSVPNTQTPAPQPKPVSTSSSSVPSRKFLSLTTEGRVAGPSLEERLSRLQPKTQVPSPKQADAVRGLNEFSKPAKSVIKQSGVKTLAKNGAKVAAKGSNPILAGITAFEIGWGIGSFLRNNCGLDLGQWLWDHGVGDLVDSFWQWKLGEMPLNPIDAGDSGNTNSHDPNDLVGVTGFGERNFIAPGQGMPFMIRFENDSEATAPTRWMRIFTTFDDAYDIDTFTLNSFYLAGHLIELEEGRDSFNQMLTLNFNGQDVLVDVKINLDREERKLTAEFMAIDPETGTMIQDMETGMLFPNDETGRGDGYITYTIETKGGLATGTTVNNAADIYFDFNEVIPTPEITYTIDGDGPASRMLAAEDMMDGGKMQISWEGADAEGGSGLSAYCVFVSKDGGDFELLGIFDADTTSVTCQGEDKAQYDFYVLAMDNVGNLETAKETAETGVFIDSSKWLTTATKGKKVTFGWPAVEGAYSYVVTVTRADGTGKPTVKKVTKPTLVATLADNFYDWTVTAVTKKGEVLEEMSGRTFQVDSKAPTKVAKLAAAQKEGAEGATAVLTWAAATDVSPVKYVVEYSVKSNFAKGTVTTLETAGLAAALPVEPGKYVYYRVRAVDAFGNMSAWATGKYGEPSIPPTGQKIDSVTGRKVAVSWEAAEGAKSYVVTLKNVLTGKVALTKTVKTTNVLLTVPDGEYTWTVQAVSAAGIRSLDVPDGSLLLDLTAPKAVTKLTSARTGEEGMTLTWTAPKDATGLRYVVEYSENADFSASTTMEVDGTSAAISAAAGAQLYCRVKALDRADNESPWTALGVLTATTKGKVVTLGWAAVAGAASYTVTFTGEDGKTVVKKVKTNALTATLADNVYGWTVQALDKKGQALSEVTGKGFKVDSIAPVKVAGLTATRKTGAVGGTAVLTWDASADASDVTYIIEYSTKSNFAKGTVTTLETADLTAELPVTPGQYIYYRVTAVDSFGNKSKAVGGKYGEPAIAPAELVCTVDNKTVTLGWAAVEGAKSYIVTFTNVETGKVTVKTAKTNSLKTAMAVGGYTWTVQTVSAAGIKSDGAEGAEALYIGMAPPPVVDPDYGTLTTAMPAGEAQAWLPAASDPLETGAPAAVETVGTGVQTPTGGIDQELALSAGVACTPGTVTGLADTGCVYALEPETEATRRQAMLASPLH